MSVMIKFDQRATTKNAKSYDFQMKFPIGPKAFLKMLKLL